MFAYEGCVMRLCGMAAAVAVLFVSMTPVVAGESGLYVSGHGGWSFPDKTTSEFNSPGLPGGVGNIVTDPDDGYRVGGAAGYIFNRYISGEVEVTYAEHDISNLRVRSFATGGVLSPPIPAKGDASTLSGMVNGYLSLPIDTVWRPYVGGGIGYSRVSANGIGFAGIPGDTDDSDSVFTWQLIAGVGFDIAPNLELGGRYRYQHVDETTLYNSAGDEQRIDSAEAHSAEITLTWKLDREAPAPLK
jgi:opacity protein-like surface antigen